MPRGAVLSKLSGSPGIQTTRPFLTAPSGALLHPSVSPSHPQSLRREIQAHRPRVDEVLERAGAIATIKSPEGEAVRLLLEKLSALWAALREETEQRQQLLDATYQVQQYYFDVAEVEAWLSEQELFLMNEEKGKVRGRRQGALGPEGDMGVAPSGRHGGGCAGWGVSAASTRPGSEAAPPPVHVPAAGGRVPGKASACPLLEAGSCSLALLPAAAEEGSMPHAPARTGRARRASEPVSGAPAPALCSPGGVQQGARSAGILAGGGGKRLLALLLGRLSCLPPLCLHVPLHAQDEQSTLQLLKKHLLTEQTVENYAETIAQLSRQCRALLELGHPDR